MDRTIPGEPDRIICPVARTAEIVAGKWTLLIIRDLASGVKRFHQLERSLHGISPKTLSERLRSLEEEGVIFRQTRSEEHTSELQSPCNLVCRLLLEKKKR